ncbi:hypothetical protein NIES2107_36890 [Nostoc carneum NIES-2107]|nr:hypothetical protein NIES2107_36890 [Nostoc carneum NIES-2107]
MSSYQEVLHQAQSLTYEEQICLIEDLSRLIRQQMTMKSQAKRSILKLRGLGKEIWNRIDAQEYVNEERDSWNG